MLKRALIGLLLLLMPGFALATDELLADVIATLETPFKAGTPAGDQIRDFQAEFVQKSHIASINRVQRGEGTVRFRFRSAVQEPLSAAQFRWDYRLPSVQEILSDGRTLWVYVPENQQVIESDVSRLNEDQGENPVTFLSGLENLSRDFVIAWSPEQRDDKGNYQLLLKPRKESQLVAQMQVVVSQKAVNQWRQKHKAGSIFPITATLVTDAQGNRTEIEFFKSKMNLNLPADLFTFVIPAGVDRVTPEQMSF